MSGQVVQVDLDARALRYVRESLGRKMLTREVLQHLHMREGRLYTYLPGDLAAEVDVMSSLDLRSCLSWRPNLKRHQYEHADGTRSQAVEIENVGDTLVRELITSFLQKQDNGVFILDDPLAKPSDPAVAKRDFRNVLTYDEEVYYYACRADVDNGDAIIPQFLAIVEPWFFGGILTTVPDGVTLDGKRDVDLDLLKKLAQGTKKIIIGAFDGDSYIVWDDDGHRRNVTGL